MLRLHVPVAGAAATLALDRLLQVAPLGVHERPDGLVMHAQELPPLEDMRAALGVQALEVTEVADVAAERLAEIARPEPVDGRLLVRADWMARRDDVTEVVLADTSAFGTGSHPTTRDCLSLLLELDRGGAFAPRLRRGRAGHRRGEAGLGTRDGGRPRPAAPCGRPP